MIEYSESLITLVNAIFGATKIKAVFGIFEGADSKYEVCFSVSNLLFLQSSSRGGTEYN